MIFFTSDLHLAHNNCLKINNRPFNTIEEMNETLINNINKIVKENDTLYILGDFYFGKDQLNQLFEYAEKIKCKHKVLIKGNHDNRLDRIIKNNNGVFETIISYLELKYNKKLIILCHYPFSDGSWNKACHGSVHLHGHIHSDSSYNQANREKSIFKYDVGVDANNYFPVSIEQILEFFNDMSYSRKDCHRNTNNFDD